MIPTLCSHPDMVSLPVTMNHELGQVSPSELGAPLPLHANSLRKERKLQRYTAISRVLHKNPQRKFQKCRAFTPVDDFNPSENQAKCGYPSFKTCLNIWVNSQASLWNCIFWLKDGLQCHMSAKPREVSRHGSHQLALESYVQLPVALAQMIKKFLKHIWPPQGVKSSIAFRQHPFK